MSRSSAPVGHVDGNNQRTPPGADSLEPMPGMRALGHRRYHPPVSTPPPPATDLRLVVGYDGSPPATRALDGAVNLLQGRTGRIHVVYVAHMASMAELSPGAVVEVEESFDEIEQELRASAGEQLSGRVEGWEFERRQGLIPSELIAATEDLRTAHPGATVAIVVGSSSHSVHRVVGSAAVSLARHSPVPLVIVP